MARSRPISIEAYVQRKKKKKHLINREENWVARQWTTVPLLRGEKSRIFGDYHADCYAIYLEWSVKGCVANLKGGTFMPAGWLIFFFLPSFQSQGTELLFNLTLNSRSFRFPFFFSFYLFVRNERKIRNELGQPKYSREPSVMLIAGGIAIFSRQRARPVSFH